MTVAYDTSFRAWPQASHHSGSVSSLEEKYEVIKEIGDGSFGSVALGRVRSAGAHIARRGTFVAIKTMKKTFDSFNQCLELREVIFLRSLPAHSHLVPALDIFLDPYSKKLHIAMEYMDGNLYQLMKARDHKQLDGASVKSILFQIISGLEHIHDHSFFHRDIKPENILVSTSSPSGGSDLGNTFKRYSALVTPPSTPPAYSIKIADFGLARETHSKLPYTTYVSTRWYRAPEVLLRAGEYSAPVDLWAVGAMAVEIATLKPLFPGGNEVDQVWRVCEIMGSPGSWVNKHGVKVGGGEWKDGVRLAQKLGFSFPKMAPHTMDSILQAPQWPAALADFVTWCLMWDPKARPTSSQALRHDYFFDAYDPLRPKTSSSRLLTGKKSNLGDSLKEANESGQSITTKTSAWFRKSLARESSAPAVPTLAVVSPQQQQQPQQQPPVPSPRPQPVHASSEQLQLPGHQQQARRPNPSKRATWTTGLPSNAAPIPILPSIKPISPLVSESVAVQQASARAHQQAQQQQHGEQASRKVGRQLSVASHGNHYPDLSRQEAERSLNAGGSHSGLTSPVSGGGAGGQRESFFSHLRKRARRFSGRYQTPVSPSQDAMDISVPWPPTQNNRLSAMGGEQLSMQAHVQQPDAEQLEHALQEAQQQNGNPLVSARRSSAQQHLMKRFYSVPTTSSEAAQHHHHPAPPAVLSSNVNTANVGRARRISQQQVPQKLPSAHQQQKHHYDAPNEEEELLDEALTSAHRAMKRMDNNNNYQRHTPIRPQGLLQQSATDPTPRPAAQQQGGGGYLMTPSPSAKRNSVGFGQGQGVVLPSQATTATKPMDIVATKPRGGAGAGTGGLYTSQWPTPPYEESDWAAGVAASIFAAQAAYH